MLVFVQEPETALTDLLQRIRAVQLAVTLVDLYGLPETLVEEAIRHLAFIIHILPNAHDTYHVSRQAAADGCVDHKLDLLAAVRPDNCQFCVLKVGTLQRRAQRYHHLLHILLVEKVHQVPPRNLLLGQPSHPRCRHIPLDDPDLGVHRNDRRTHAVHNLPQLVHHRLLLSLRLHPLVVEPHQYVAANVLCVHRQQHVVHQHRQPKRRIDLPPEPRRAGTLDRVDKRLKRLAGPKVLPILDDPLGGVPPPPDGCVELGAQPDEEALVNLDAEHARRGAHALKRRNVRPEARARPRLPRRQPLRLFPEEGDELGEPLGVRDDPHRGADVCAVHAPRPVDAGDEVHEVGLGVDESEEAEARVVALLIHVVAELGVELQAAVVAKVILGIEEV
mmetsp:Transcript_38734/g.97009  ORF Transcript_38734/g.97009 Transcript_38734/m.97009 type:complete len:390 (+) Transcript_38734:1716-2885(+)